MKLWSSDGPIKFPVEANIEAPYLSSPMVCNDLQYLIWKPLTIHGTSFRVSHFISKYVCTFTLLQKVYNLLCYFKQQSSREDRRINHQWQKHLLGWALFLAWMDLTIFLGKMDFFGQRLYMSWQTMKGVAWSLLVFVPSLIAFATAFHCFLSNNFIFQGKVICIRITISTFILYPQTLTSSQRPLKPVSVVSALTLRNSCNSCASSVQVFYKSFVSLFKVFLPSGHQP